MANANQGVRSGNAFGRIANTHYGQIDTENVALKPGHLLRIRNRFHLVEAVEPMVVDLWYTDTMNVGNASSSDLNGTNGEALEAYGIKSVQAYFDLGTSSVAAANKTGNILAPDFDSNYITFDDLEPHKGNLYQLCPTLPLQPKYMYQTGEWHSSTGVTPFDVSGGGEPIGFAGDDEQEHLTQIGTVSGKLYIKHPAGVPRHVLDRAPTGDSGDTGSESKIHGMSGFIDGSMSAAEAPNWSYSLWIEHGDNNLPALKFCNDSDEYLLDGRVRMIGWKYRITELTDEQMQTFKQRSGGRLRFMIINTTGLPIEGAMLADYFPK